MQESCYQEVNLIQYGLEIELRKIIYIRIVFTNTSLDRAKEIAATTLEVINDEYKSHYDIHYTLVQEATDTAEGYTIMGSRNIRSTSSIIWNNNTPITSEEQL